MSEWLLATKLYVPRPHRELVPRPRLTERLDTGLQGKLTLVSAPVGYGKTMLVSDWVGHSDVPVTWLSLDQSDNDIARFFGYLIAALQQIDPGIGTDIQPIVEPGTDLPMEHLLTALVNDIAATEGRLALVLDDYHVIHEIKIHQTLDFLFDHLPPGMHVLIISRTDPPMPLGRLRVQQQLTEIREADLRFTVEEADAFFNDLMALSLSSEDVENLEARTEGWIAGLQLAALTIQGRPDQKDRIAAITGSQRYLIDYLAQEVMSRQPEEVQTFLLRTSILERLNASLCDAVVGNQQMGQGDQRLHAKQHGQAEVVREWANADSRAILAHLERANLFLIPLDDERQWCRYHHLFADFLRQCLHRALPEIVPELYARASQWYEAQGMVDEAIEHALAGDDVAQAARLLDAHIQTLLMVNTRVSQVLRWADRLPLNVRARFPRLCIFHAWALQFELQLEAVEPTLALAEAHLADPEEPQPTRQSVQFSASQITRSARVVRAFAARQRGDCRQAIELSLAALKSLPKGETGDIGLQRGTLTINLGMAYIRLGQVKTARAFLQSALGLNLRAGSRYAVLGCIEYLMLAEFACGRLGRALAHGEKGLAWIEEWSHSEGLQQRPVRMLAHLRRMMGQVLYEMDDLTQAAEYLDKCTAYDELVQSQVRMLDYALLIGLHQALGDVDAALGYLQKLDRIGPKPGSSLGDILPTARIAEGCLLISRLRPGLSDLLTRATTWAETSGLRPDDEFRGEQEYEYLTFARVRIAQGRAGEAIPVLDRLIASAEDAGRRGYGPSLPVSRPGTGRGGRLCAHLPRPGTANAKLAPARSSAGHTAPQGVRVQVARCLSGC